MPVNFLSSDFMEWFRFQIFYTISRQCSKIFLRNMVLVLKLLWSLKLKNFRLNQFKLKSNINMVMKCQAYVILLSKPSCISLLTFKGLRRKTCQIWKKYEINTNKSLCTYAYNHVHTHTHAHTHTHTFLCWEVKNHSLSVSLFMKYSWNKQIIGFSSTLF